MTRGEKAEARFFEGYNCAQAVTVAYADLLGLSDDMAARMASGFGGGVSRLREVCGAFSGAVMVMSMLRGYDQPLDLEGKKALYDRVQRMAAAYKEKVGALACRDVLKIRANVVPPVPATIPGHNPACAELCRIAADILEAELANE
ncbi:MAG: C_GCAxxG_C_C family protein [Oscillospiraceae bacterium]|nr:C_GCAxxG_C_C family protein [Oscillospiraceae bacterium]